MKAEFLLTREKNTELTIYTAPNQEFPLHFHSHIEICLVLSGEVETCINNQKQLLKAGDISVAWICDTHEYSTPTESQVLSLIIPPMWFSEFLPILNNNCVSSPFISDKELFDKLYSWIKEIEKSDDELMKKGYIYLILSSLIKYMHFEKTAIKTDRVLSSKILIFLNEHFRENITLVSVANALGYHPNYISQFFKRTLKISFVQYLNILRSREALVLIQSGKKTISECAFECGFQSLRTFYRTFHSMFGLSPRDFMRDTSIVENDK